jgi:exodeoxyribonuclease V beta subunit
VFVAGLDPGKAPSKSGIIFYEENQQRMLSFSSRNAAQLEAHQQREQAELRRLIYVALTRASIRLYVVAPPAPGKDGKLKGALYHWLPAERESWSDDNTLVQNGLSACPQFIYKQLSSHVDIDARPLPSHRVYAWGLTSFSQLSSHYKTLPLTTVMPVIANHTGEQPSADSALAEQATAADTLMHYDEPLSHGQDNSALQHTPTQYANQSHAAQQSVTQQGASLQNGTLQSPTLQNATLNDKTSSPELPLCFTFPRGANAGDCLHHVLEQLNPKDPKHWPQIFEKQLQNFAINAQLKRYGHPAVNLEHMTNWFNDILHADLPDGATLASVDGQIHEFEFHLSVSDQAVDTQAIGQLLVSHGVPVAPLNRMNHARYLHGFIDLVYVHQDKYYIADYKSNYLGNAVTAYQPAALRENMSSSSYWLQAVLYQLALHRFLKLRLPNYQPAQHLGGAVYLYLRGMQQGCSQQGILHWQASEDLLNQLDQLLGQHDPWQ